MRRWRTRGSVLPRNDLFLVDHVGLDPADKQRAVVGKPLHLRCGGGALEGWHVIVPQLGNAIDFDAGIGDVGAGARAGDVRLHVAPYARYRMRQWSVNLQPVADELLVGDAFLAGEQG